MGYQGEKRFRIDLGTSYVRQPCEEHKDSGFDGDCPECDRMPERTVDQPHLRGKWVEVLNPDMLSYGRRKELYTPLPDLEPGARLSERRQHAEEVRARHERIVAGLITAWNLTAVDGDDDATLQLPKDDPNALNLAPDIIGLVLLGIARERRRAETGLPKAPATV